MPQSVAQDDANAKIYVVNVPVMASHRLLRLRAALDWPTLTKILSDHLRGAGCNVDGVLRGRRMDVNPYVPMIVLMLVMRLNLRQMEDYLAENAVGRLFMGLENSPEIQVRDHSTIGRIVQALGAAGFEALNAVIVQHAVLMGFANTTTLSADTTAQELAIGYPHEAGILRGLAARCLRAYTRLRKEGKRKIDDIKEQALGVVAKAKAYHLFAKTREQKNQVLQSMVLQTQRLLLASKDVIERCSAFCDANIQSAVHVLQNMSDVGAVLLPQIKSWMKTGKVAAGKILHAGLPMARSIVRNKPGKKVEFGIQYLIAAVGGGYLLGRSIVGNVGENQMPQRALALYRETFGRAATPDLFIYDRGGWSQANVALLKKEGVKKVGVQPRGRARYRVHGTDRDLVMKERSAIEGKIGTLKTAYGMNKPKERLKETVLAVGPRSITAFNLNKMMKDIITIEAAAA